MDPIQKRVTGHAMLLPVDEQQVLWDQAVRTFNSMLADLDARGQNPLVAKRLDLKARSQQQHPLTPGVENSPNPFEQPSYLEEMSVLKQGDSMTTVKVQEKLTELYGTADPTELETKISDWQAQQINDLTTKTEEFVTPRLDKILDPQKRSDQQDSFNGMLERTKDAMQMFAPGTPVMYRSVQMIEGVVVGFRREGKAQNPSAPSAWTIEVALADTMRMAKVAVSSMNVPHDQQPLQYHPDSLEDVLPKFDAGGTSSRETRWIATGNVVSGFEPLAKQHGQLIFYTDEDGNTHRGILMPKQFNAQRWALGRPTEMTNPQEILRAVANRQRVQTPDGLISLLMTRDGNLQVWGDGNLRKIAIYAQNPGVRAASDSQFYKLGSRSRMEVSDQARYAPTIQALMDVEQVPFHVFNPQAPQQGGGGSGGGRSGSGNIQYGPNASIPVSPNPVGKTISTGEIVKKLEENFGVPIRTGHFRGGRRRAGIYKELEKVVRLKGYGDVAAASHEVAHHLDNTMKLLRRLPRALRAELSALDYNPTRADFHEGFAEYMRHLLTMDDAATVAPQFDAWFRGSYLSLKPDIAEAVAKSKAVVDTWRGAGSLARVKAQIYMGEALFSKAMGFVKNPRTVVEWINNNWINRLGPLLKASKQMVGVKTYRKVMQKMDPNVNFWVFAKDTSMAASSRARSWYKDGIGDVMGNKIGPGLKETLKPIAKELRNRDTLLNFYSYCYARHALDVISVGKNPGILEQNALDVVSQFDSRPGWRAASDGLTDWHNALIDYLVDAGGLSQELSDLFKMMYPHYISLARKMDSEFMGPSASGGSRYVNLPSAIKRLKGSGREIMPPLESALAIAERILGIADKTRVGRMMVEASEKYGTLGDTVEEVDPKTIPQVFTLDRIQSQLEQAGADLSAADMDSLLTVFSQNIIGDPKDNIVVLFREGKKKCYYLRTDLYRALTAYDKPFKMHYLLDITAGKLARLARLGATGIRPAFAIMTNPPRDFMVSLPQTEYQTRNPFSILTQRGWRVCGCGNE